jgi:hypothetical protein
MYACMSKNSTNYYNAEPIKCGALDTEVTVFSSCT